MGAHIAAFFGVSILVIVIPGQDTVLTIRNTLLGGRAAGVCTALGVATGQAIWAAATSLGLAAVVAASRPAFDTIRLAGAVYLVYLGGRALYDALRSDQPALEDRGSDRPRAAYRQGVLSNLGNPKMAIFFTSLLPQFSAHGHNSVASPLGLGLVFCLLTLTWLSSYAVVVAKAGDVLRRARVRRAVDGIAGAALVALGLRLAADRLEA